MLRGPPAENVAGGHESIQQFDCRLRDVRPIVEFDDERQIDVQTKQVRRMNLSIVTKASDAAQNNDTLHAMLIVKDVQDLLHEGLSLPVVGFTEVNANHHHLVVHASP